MENADQAELLAITAGMAVVDTGVRDEIISGAVDDFDVGEGAMLQFQRQDLALDGEVGATRDEIIRRQALLGDLYPFELKGGSLVHRGGDIGIYEYCLAICLSPSLRKKPYTRLPRTFERITSVLVRSHLGERWAVYHTGAPRDPVAGKSFYACMRRLSEVSSEKREFRWDPAPSHPKKPKGGGDGGVDFVVWRPSPDKRIGQLYILGQCACGNDWPDKFNDISLPRLGKWFRPLAEVPVTKCFASPFWMSDGNFLAATSDAGWTLDRGRLTFLAAEAEGDLLFRRWKTDLSELFGLVAEAA